jgi:hypothetical protein
MAAPPLKPALKGAGADQGAGFAVAAVAAGKSPAADTSDDLTTWERGERPQLLRQRSIYESWTTRKRYTLLGLMSFATFLVPFSDTVYLPAMNVIQKDLKTTATLVRIGLRLVWAVGWSESGRLGG